MRCHTASEFEFCVALLSCTLVISSYTNIFSYRWFANLAGVTAAEAKAPIRDLELAFFVNQLPPVVFPKFEIRRRIIRNNEYHALPCMAASTFLSVEGRRDLENGFIAIKEYARAYPVWSSPQTTATQHKAVDYTKRRTFKMFSDIPTMNDCTYDSIPHLVNIEPPPGRREGQLPVYAPLPLQHGIAAAPRFQRHNPNAPCIPAPRLPPPPRGAAAPDRLSRARAQTSPTATTSRSVSANQGRAAPTRSPRSVSAGPTGHSPFTSGQASLPAARAENHFPVRLLLPNQTATRITTPNLLDSSISDDYL